MAPTAPAFHRREPWLLMVVWLALVLLLALNFDRYLDITDEGIYLYLLMDSAEATFLSPFYTVFAPLGALFGHNLIGYRVLAVIVITVGVLYAAAGATRFFASQRTKTERRIFTALLAIISLVYFYLIATLSYNTVASAAAYCWAGALLMLAAPNPRRVMLHQAVLAVALLLALLGRPPFGVVLLAMTPLAAIAQHAVLKRRLPLASWGFAALATLALIGLYVATHQPLIGRLWTIYPQQIQSSHPNVIGISVRQVITALAQQWVLLGLGAGALLLARYRTREAQWLAWAAAAMVAGQWLLWLGKGKIYTMFLDAPAVALTLNGLLAIAMWFQRRRRADAWAWIYAVALCCGAGMASGLGTNADIMSGGGYSLALLALPPCAWLLFETGGRMQRDGTRLLAGLMAVVVALIFWHAYFTNYGRADRRAAHTVTMQTGTLRGVRVTPQLADTLAALKQALAAVKFDPKHDRVMAYPDLPGLLAGAGVRAYANPWMLTRYPNTHLTNCAYVAMEPTRPIRHVYFLLGEMPDTGLQNCLDTALAKHDDFVVKPLGEFYHYRNETDSELTLEGPYLLR